jgi:hypothetical protein
MPEQGVLRAAARLIDAATDHPESAIGAVGYLGDRPYAVTLRYNGDRG